MKVPRPAHAAQNPEEVETFKRDFFKQLERFGQETALPIRIWLSDEMRYGLKPVLRRVWSERGKKPVLPIRPRYQWGYTYGALEIGGKNAAEFLHTDGVSLEASRMFLEETRKSDPRSYHIVIWDGAGFHQKEGKGELPKNIGLIKLPAYSPELNAIEGLWNIMQDELCNVCWENLAKLKTSLTKSLKRYWRNGELVSSLVGNGWVPREANGSYSLIHLK